MSKQHIAFIGLGVMGGPMATNLVKAGFALTIYDHDRAKAGPIIKEGARWGDSIAHAVSNADVVMTSLPGPPQVREVALSPDGILANLGVGKTRIELSTNNLTVCSGGDEGSRAGTLTILVGGEEKYLPTVAPFLM